MKLKTTLLAASVALALVGCGSDSDNNSSSDNNGNNGGSTSQLAEKAVIAVPTEGKFIDAKVIGLFYKTGDVTDFTTNEGAFDIDQENPNVTFILGNEFGGLVLGSSSGRHVVTPYEAVGTQDRAVNLARLLLTINENDVDPVDAAEIAIPSQITGALEGSEILSLLAKVQLDDFEPGVGLNAVNAVLTALSIPVEKLVSAEDALKHFETAPGSLAKTTDRGSDVALTHWAKGSNWTFVERSSKQRVSYDHGRDFDLVLQMDRTLGEELYTKVTGLSVMYFKSTKEALVGLPGSNDGSVSGDKMAMYLTCEDQGGEADISRNNTDGFTVVTCDDEAMFIEDIDPKFAALQSAGGNFVYSFVNPSSTSESEEKFLWNEMTEFGGVYECMAKSSCTEQAMTKYEVVRRNDADEGDSQEQWQTETMSGSYDPITDVYTQVRRKHEENSGYISEEINFIYPVEKMGIDRYVDFVGTWKVTNTANHGSSVVTETWEFTETGVIIDGKETSYQELAMMDYWWFGTNKAGLSKAALDQLNSTIRWNDRMDGESEDKFKVNRFSYIPAGKNWDRGVLTSYTLDQETGNKLSTVTMQKN